MAVALKWNDLVMSLYEDQFDAKHDLTYEGEKPSKYLIIAPL